jgi:hypothetical protein
MWRRWTCTTAGALAPVQLPQPSVWVHQPLQVDIYFIEYNGKWAAHTLAPWVTLPGLLWRRWQACSNCTSCSGAMSLHHALSVNPADTIFENIRFGQVLGLHVVRVASAQRRRLEC